MPIQNNDVEDNAVYGNMIGEFYGITKYLYMIDMGDGGFMETIKLSRELTDELRH